MRDDLEIFLAAETGTCVMFTGPAEARALARRIHDLSGWREGPFVSVDCGWPESVIERRLFDVLSGDHIGTGDVRAEPPRAPAGTFLLCNVGMLSPALQARLTEALEETAASRHRRSCMRPMAWTPEPLLPRVVEGTFDDRLFYRLNAIHMVLPPERDSPPNNP